MRAPARWTGSLALLAACALGAWTRLTNWAGVLRPERVFFGGLDSYYHARRARLAAGDSYWPPSYDAWVNHPEGALIDWPFGYDMLLALVAGLGDTLGGVRGAEVAMALVPPALGVAGVALCYVVARGMMSRGRALGAAFGFAVLPLLTNYSMVGRIDHHTTEPLLALAAWGLSAGLLKRPTHASAAALGLALAASVAIWPGALALGGVAFAGLAAAALLGHEGAARAGAQAFAWAAAGSLAVGAVHPWMELGSFAHYAPAWLQPCAFGAAAAGLIGATRGGRARRLAALTLLPVLAAALVLALVPAAREAASVTLGYLSRSEAQIATVHESRPVWQAGARFVQQYTWLLVLVPPMPLHAAWRAWLGKDEERALWTAFVFWLAGTGFLAAMQLRLGLMFAPLACLALPAMLGDFAERLGAATGRPRAVRAALAVALAAVLVPLLSLHRPLAVSGARPFLKSYDALEWLGRGAARPGEAEELGSKASFAVAARWQWGHWLNYVSGQANIANPLGQTAQNLRGVRRSTSFFLAEDAKAAGRLADELGIRYTLATPVIEEVREIAAHAGRSPGRYLRTGDDGAPVVEAAFLRTMNSRLLHFDGTGFAVSGSREGPLRRWRMVFECRAPTEVLGRKAAYCKVFERVAGARVRVRTSPGGVVLLGLRLRTNNGRVFEWGDAALADDSGVARLRAPYAAGGGGPVSNGAVTALGPYQLEIEGRRRTLSVGEAAVLEGGSLSVE